MRALAPPHRAWRHEPAHFEHSDPVVPAQLGACYRNGLNLIGFGAESDAMGGADVALSHGTTALNADPGD